MEWQGAEGQEIAEAREREEERPCLRRGKYISLESGLARTRVQLMTPHACSRDVNYKVRALREFGKERLVPDGRSKCGPGREARHGTVTRGSFAREDARHRTARRGFRDQVVAEVRPVMERERGVIRERIRGGEV